MRAKVRAVLFDLDGTVFDVAERDAFACWEALRGLGYDVSLGEVRRCYRCGLGSLSLVGELGISLSKREVEEFIKLRFASFVDGENALGLTRLHDGAYEVLASLSDRYRLVLVTSRGSLASVKKELEWFGIRKFFGVVVTREVAARFHGVIEIPLLPFREQRMRLYECVAGLTGIRPKDMLCVGDSVGELEPAKRLGIKTIGVLCGLSSKEELEKAGILIIKNITQLIKILF